MLMYNDKTMEHFRNPRNVGEIDDADGVGQAGDPDTGDVMRLYIRVAGGRIIDAKHQTFGNAIAIAASSVSSLMVIGKTLQEAYMVSKEDVSDALDGIPPDKMNCSNMAPDAIRAAIDDYRSRQDPV